MGEAWWIVRGRQRAIDRTIGTQAGACSSVSVGCQDRSFYLLRSLQHLRDRKGGGCRKHGLDCSTRPAGLFYAEGLHAVGIDRIIATAQVTRATLYRHFPSKDDLIVAYLTQADEAIRARVNAARTQAPPPTTSFELSAGPSPTTSRAPASEAARSSTPPPNTPTRPIRSTRRSSGTGSGFWPR